MGRQGYSNVLVTPEVHEQLSYLKVKFKKRSYNDLIKAIIALLPPKDPQ